MKFKNLFAGFMLTSISPFFHASYVLAGITLNFGELTTLQIDYPQTGGAHEGETLQISISVAGQMTPFFVSMVVHSYMIVAAFIVNALTMKGRHLNMIRHTPEQANSYFFFSMIFNVVSTFIFIFYVIYINSKYFILFLCPLYTGVQPYCFGLLSAPLVFVFLSVMAFVAYMFGIMLYVLTRMLKGMMKNEMISEATKQFSDYLVLKNNEARWAGFQFALIWLVVFGIFGMYGYNSWMVNNQGESPGSFWLLYLCPIISLVLQVSKIFFFQPLYEAHKLTKEEMEEDMGELMEELDNNQKEELENANDVEEEKKDVWYDVRRNRIQTKYVLVWPITLGINVVLLIVYCINSKNAPFTNIFSGPTFYIGFYGDLMMCFQFLKQMGFDKYRHLYKFIEGHQRECIDPTLLLMTAEQLTEKSKKLYANLEAGADIYSKGFLNLNYRTQRTMQYTIDDVVSNNSQVFGTFFIQLGLIYVFYADFALNSPYLIPAKSMAESICRMGCVMVLHAMTEKIIRQGLAHMKYAINHHEEFEMPFIAALIGFMNALIVNLLALAIICNICSKFQIDNTLLAFIAYAQCCMVGTWAVNEIPIGNHLKTPIPTLQIKNHRRFITSRPKNMMVCRFVYKSYRCFYATVWFYWTPIISLILPSCVLLATQRPITAYGDWQAFMEDQNIFNHAFIKNT